MIRLSRLPERSGALFLLLAVLCAAGVAIARRLPSAIFPAVTFPRIKVIADAGEEPAAQMIPAVTRPLEEAILRVPGIERVTSTTTRGEVELGAEFSWSTNMQVALARVQAQIERVRPDLPPGTRIDAEWMNTATFPILGYALTSDTRPLSELRELADFRLKPELAQIPGVSQVQVEGGTHREFQVRLDPQRLAGRKLSAAQVVEAIRKNDEILSAGLVEANHELYLTLVSGKAANLDALGRIALPSTPGGIPVSVGDLGTVSPADAVTYIHTTADRKPAVLLSVIRQPDASTLAIAESVETLLRERKDLLPPGVRWITSYDQAEFVRASVHGARDAILIGVALAALVLLVYLRDLKIAAIAVATIPVTVAIVLLGLGISGHTINLMTLGGIAAAIGLVADDAIVVVENIARHAEERVSENPSRSGLAEVLPGLTGSSLSTIVIFFPFALLTGVAGAFFRPLAFTIGLALAVSYVLSALAVPLAAERLRVGTRMRSARRRRPPRIARFFIAHPSVALLLTVALLFGGVLLYRRIGSDFLPAMDEGSIVLDYWTPPGTSLTDTDQMLGRVESIIMGLPDVATYARRTGTQLGFFVTEPNTGDIVIRLKPRRQRRDIEDVIDDLRAKIAAAEPAMRADFGQLLEDAIGDLTGGEPQPIDVRIYGEDQTILQEKARAAAKVLDGVSGVEDVFDGITIAGPNLVVAARPEVLARFGLTAEALHGEVQPSLTGTVAGNLRLGERIYDVRVFSRSGGPDLSRLAELPILTPGGGLVPLSVLATISTGPPEAEIHRENLRTYLGATARLSGRSLGGAIEEIRSRLAGALTLPPGMSIRYAGLYEQQQKSFKELLGVLFGGLLLVSIILLFEFRDWRAPLLTVVVAVAVLTSVLGSLIATGTTLNISSFVGAIMMVGIVGEKAVFLIQDAREELRRGLPVAEAWAEASRKRLRAVMMTIFATAFALAPLALALGEGSQLQQPLAIAVIGGFVLSSPLVLLILPSLYAWMDPKGRLAGGPRPAPPPPEEEASR